MRAAATARLPLMRAAAAAGLPLMLAAAATRVHSCRQSTQVMHWCVPLGCTIAYWFAVHIVSHVMVG